MKFDESTLPPIEDNIPLPNPKAQVGGNHKYAFYELKSGQSRFYPALTPNAKTRIQMAASRWRKFHPEYDLITRTAYNGVRVWRR